MTSRLYLLVGALMLAVSACGSTDVSDTANPEAADPEGTASVTALSVDETTAPPSSAPPDSTDSTSEAPQGSTSAPKLGTSDEVKASQLVVGDCFQIFDLENFWADELVDCSKPHDGEVVFLIDPVVDVVAADFANTAYALCDLAYEEKRGNRFIDDPGPLFAFLVDVDNENKPVSELVCALHTRVDDGFVGSFLTSSTIDVFQGVVATTELVPGECFIVINQTNVGEPVECGPETLLSLGVVDSTEDFGDLTYPGTDVLRDYRSEKCLALFDRSGFRGDPASISGVIPDQIDWDIHGLRLISCDIEWVG